MKWKKKIEIQVVWGLKAESGLCWSSSTLHTYIHRFLFMVLAPCSLFRWWYSDSHFGLYEPCIEWFKSEITAPSKRKYIPHEKWEMKGSRLVGDEVDETGSWAGMRRWGTRAVSRVTAFKKRSGKRSANKVLLSWRRSKFKCQTTASDKCMMGDWVCEIQMKNRSMHDHSPLNFLWIFMVLRSASSMTVPGVSCRLYISDLSFSINLHLFLILDVEGAGHQSSRGF